MSDDRRHSGQSHPGPSVCHPQDDELRIFRTLLKYLCLDQSNAFSATLCWFVFFIFVILDPALSHFALSYGGSHRRPFDLVAQLSLSAVAVLSFIILSNLQRKYGLQNFLFLDNLSKDSETVRNGFTQQVNISVKILFIFVLPGLAAVVAYKVWWYISGGNSPPFLGNQILSNTVSCVLEVFSWVYRLMIFYLVCLIFHLVCYLQILRMQGIAKVFETSTDVLPVLKEHIKIRRQLRIISYRFGSFMFLGLLLIITACPLTFLLIAIRLPTEFDIFNCGELAVSYLSVLVGLMIILRSASMTTHASQALTSYAAKWHVCAMLDSFDAPTNRAPGHSDSTSDFAEVDGDVDDDDELENTEFAPSYSYSTASFHKRQAMVAYLENNKAGITVFGIMLDRSSLYTMLFRTMIILCLMSIVLPVIFHPP